MSRTLNAHEIALYQSFLQHRATIEAIENRQVFAPSPNDSNWQNFLAQLTEGDELWEFSSPPHDWQNMVGESGIALVRNGAVCAVFTSFEN